MNRERSSRFSMLGILATTLVAVSFSTTSIADEDSGLYLGGGFGQFGLEFDNIDDAVEDFDFDDSDQAYKLFAGWRFGPYIAAELAYMNLGAPNEQFDDGVDQGVVEAEIDGFAPYVVGTLPLGMFEVFARVGYLFYNVDVNLELGDDDLDIGDSESDEAFVYGVGAGVNLFEHLNVRLEYERFEISDADNADAYWVTAAWRF